MEFLHANFLTKEYPLELYPTIDTSILNVPIIAFDKLDGSNIRAEWTRKNGFAKFGTRKRLLDPGEEMLGEAIPLFMEKYDDDLNRIFRKERFDKATVFFEFYGENSFAGYHAEEEHTVTLFDIHKYKQGLLPARDFLKLVGNKVDIPAVLHEGKATENFVRSVRTSRLEGMTFEGVICKGGLDNRRRPIAFKVKSDAWLEKLKGKCGEDTRLFQELK